MKNNGLSVVAERRRREALAEANRAIARPTHTNSANRTVLVVLSALAIVAIVITSR